MAQGEEPEAGALYVFFGGPQADARPDLVLRGGKHNDFFGMFSAGSTDFDGDGFADILVGANGRDAPTDSAGAVVFYRGGPRLDDVPDLALRGSDVRTGFGVTFAPIGDTNGDGFPDLAVGCPGDRRGGSNAGAVKVFDFARFHVVRPLPERDTWTAGGKGTLEWLGATRADVSLSLDDGRSWKIVQSRVGGGSNNAIAVDVPASAAGGRVRVRIAPADHSLKKGAAEVTVPVTGPGGS